MSKLVCTYKDYGIPGELSTVVFTGVDLTNLNIVAESAAADALRLAAEAITLGGIQKRALVAWENDTRVEPSDPFAQREMKWLVKYTDDVTSQKYQLEMPCADLQYLDPNNSDKALMTAGPVAAFVSAFEAFQKSPGDGNPVTVNEILFVGRRT